MKAKDVGTGLLKPKPTSASSRRAAYRWKRSVPPNGSPSPKNSRNSRAHVSELRAEFGKFSMPPGWLKKSGLNLLIHIALGSYALTAKLRGNADRMFNEYYKESFCPSIHHQNLAISVTGTGSTKDFSCLIVNTLPDLEVISKGQCFPLYVYAKQSVITQDLFDGMVGDGFSRQDAITDWALHEFRLRFGPSVTKEDIFYYVYGLLHSPDYRTRFSADLKKMFPRIPFVDYKEAFWALSQGGRDLAHWHLNYETVDPWALEETVIGGVSDPHSLYRVEKMRWSKGNDGHVDMTTIVYNAHITLHGVPLEAYDYIVNGKSALEWVMERYQVKTDKDCGLLNDPNVWSEDPRYILDLVKRVVRVGIETLRIVKTLPQLSWDEQVGTA